MISELKVLQSETKWSANDADKELDTKSNEDEQRSQQIDHEKLRHTQRVIQWCTS